MRSTKRVSRVSRGPASPVAGDGIARRPSQCLAAVLDEDAVMIISVNWCDHHRIQYPCDRPCPECTKSLREMLEKADREYMEYDTPQSRFAEDLLDKLAEFIPFDRAKDAEPERKCICAQGVTKCPAHGEQPAEREICPQCKNNVLCYCAQGQYCASDECRYVS